MPSVSTQPSAVSIMDVTGKAEYEPLSQDEKHEHECCGDASASQAGPHHKRCHNNRLKRMLVPLLVSIASIIGVMALGCFASMLLGGGHHDMSHLMSRQTTGESDSGSTFTDHKYYLIVIFVGLVVVIILGIMLSAWCCKGAFQNPLCCPCYLCACCGGLACLECIGCGLCAEGFEEMA
ncbi:hypothetical protein GGF50DRAFT_65889 [Schizophyllum commune]